MSRLHAKVIINPAAGANSTRRKWSRIKQLLEHVGLSFDYEYTEGIGHAIELARAAASDGYRYLVAVGGDGLLDVVVVGDMGKFELIKALPTVYNGTHISQPKVRMAKASRVSIESSEPILVHADGELLGEGPASFEIVPAALSIVV